MLQRRRGRRDDRRTYRLTFPADVRAAHVQAWLRATGGARTTVAVELWADAFGVHHFLTVPTASAEYVAGQLRTLVPGIRVVPSKRRTMPSWSVAVELALTDMSRTLALPSVDQMAATLLAAVQGLKAGETVLWQVVIRPAVPEAVATKTEPKGRGVAGQILEGDRDAANDRRTKLSEPNYLAVLRVAVRADRDGRANQLLSRVRSAVVSTRSAVTAFRRKLVFSKAAVSKRIERAVGSLLYGAQFSVTELSALLGWPIGSPHVAGLPQGRPRQLPASATIPSTGRVIGRSNFPGAERPVAISPRDATRHLHVVGPTGTGKTTLLANLAKQDMQRGYCVIVLESKGDLYRMVLDRVPRRRIKDVIVLDVNDGDFPVGFNVLDTRTSSSAVDELSALMTGIYGDHGGVYAPMLMYYGLHALAATPGHTFIDLPALLTPQGPDEAAWRDHLVQGLKNRDVRQFWQRYLDDKNKERDRMAAPVHNRIWQLAVRPEIRNIIGQSRSSFTFEEVLTGQKILLINLNGVRVGESTASLTGTLLMNALWSAVRTVKLPKPAFLYLDEFQDFINLPVNAADMLAKTRSFGLGMVLAHQDLDQLSKVRGLEQAVLSNARSKVVFQTSARDARVMQREFGRLVTDDDFINLGAYEAIARVATKDGVSAPVTITTEAPSRTTSAANAVLASSRTAYGRPIADVEVEIENRRRSNGPNKKRPKVGPQKWG
jgi:type IV secretion system coupling TraD/TrwB family protein/helicase HerA-like protein